MVFATETSGLPEIEIRPETLARLPVGAASPLWGFYAGAALSGVAYWWMTQWTRPVDLEALFGAATAPAVPALEASEAVSEAVAEFLAPDLPAEPVGGEAAPIAPVVAPVVALEAAVVEVAETAIDTATETTKEDVSAAQVDPLPASERRPAPTRPRVPPESSPPV